VDGLALTGEAGPIWEVTELVVDAALVDAVTTGLSALSGSGTFRGSAFVGCSLILLLVYFSATADIPIKAAPVYVLPPFASDPSENAE